MSEAQYAALKEAAWRWRLSMNEFALLGIEKQIDAGEAKCVELSEPRL
jgi:hypothetical protein